MMPPAVDPRPPPISIRIIIIPKKKWGRDDMLWTLWNPVVVSALTIWNAAVRARFSSPS